MIREFCRRGVFASALWLILTISAHLNAESHIATPVNADAVVRQLRDVPTEMYVGPLSWLCASSPCPRPPVPEGEIRKRKVYAQLFSLGTTGVPALARALRSPDPKLRHGVALALSALSGGWWSWEGNPATVDIRAALPTLMTTLNDSDPDMRGLAAEAVGNIGPYAAKAVPALVKLLRDDDEAVRISACEGLLHIGPAASGALPELRRAQSDPSSALQRCARMAIDALEGVQDFPVWISPIS